MGAIVLNKGEGLNVPNKWERKVEIEKVQA